MIPTEEPARSDRRAPEVAVPQAYSRLITLAASVIVVAALYFARSVLIPFVLAVLMSFLLAPLVARLQRWHFGRVAAVVTAVLFVFVVTSTASWFVADQVRDVTTHISDYRHNIRDKLTAFRTAVAKPVDAAKSLVADLTTDLAAQIDPESTEPAIQTVRIAEPPHSTFDVLRETLGSALAPLMSAAMALLFAFVMLSRRDDLGDRLIRLVGHGKILVTTRALEEAAKKVSSYLWRLLLLNGLNGLVIGIGLAIIGVPNALLWGVLAASLRFIPYLGPWIAASFPLITALAFSTGWTKPVLTIGLFATLELITSNLLEPWFYGRGTGISPLAILVSALFWTWLWGPMGLLLSTPLTVCLVVIGKYVPQFKFLDHLFGDAPGLSPPSRLYQRLIAGDPDQTWCVLRPEIEKRELHEVYDSIVLPALAMAEHDRQRGAFDEAAEAGIEETVKLLIEEAGELRGELDLRVDPIARSGGAPSLRVICVPARGASDSLAAAMLRQVLERIGVQVEISSLAELASASSDRLAARPVDLVIISAVPPSRFMQVRYICKRIASRLPGVPIVVGLWTLALDDQSLADRMPILTGVDVIASLEAALSRVRRLADSSPVQGETTLVPAGAANESS